MRDPICPMSSVLTYTHLRLFQDDRGCIDFNGGDNFYRVPFNPTIFLYLG